MSFEPLELVHHIVTEADYLMSESASIDSSSFLADETRKRAFARSLEIIGQAAKRLPVSFVTVTRRYSGASWQPCGTS
jgi:uncharacterized protein with HEPN domain